MRKIILLTSLFFVLNNSVQAVVTVTFEELRTMFRKETPYEVFNHRFEIKRQKSYKDVYYDEELKGYLMQWLDQEQIIEYKADEFMRDIYYSESPEKQKEFIDFRIKTDFYLNPDSIRANPALSKIYEDSVIAFVRNRYIKNKREYSQTHKKEVLPEADVLFTLSEIAYPEAYKKIKDYWYQRGKRRDDSFDCLLLMKDPEVLAIINKSVEKYIQTKGDSCLFGDGFNFINSFLFWENSYVLKTLVELLLVDEEKPKFSKDGFYDSLDQPIYEMIDLKLYLREIDTSKLIDLYHIENTRKNKAEIIRVANEEIKNMEEEEKYWTENLPYDYVPQGCK